MTDLIAACSSFEFGCRSGDCVAIYDRCNGIAQCDDGSDEDPAECAAQMSKTDISSQRPNF